MYYVASQLPRIHEASVLDYLQSFVIELGAGPAEPWHSQTSSRPPFHQVLALKYGVQVWSMENEINVRTTQRALTVELLMPRE